MNTEKPFAQRLAEAMNIRGLTQAKLAERVKEAGAPRKAEKERVALSCRVRPETLAALRKMGPLGEAVDRLVSEFRRHEKAPA